MGLFRKIHVGVAVLAVWFASAPGAAHAQLSTEGERWLEEREKGEPAKPEREPQGTGKGKPVYLWRAKPNAPWVVKDWLTRLPELRRQDVAEIQRVLDRELDVLKRIELRHVDRVWSERYEKTWRPSKVDGARKRKELRTQEAIVAAIRTRRDAAANDTLYLPFPKFELADEAYGRLGEPMRIVRVIDASNCVVKVDAGEFWLTGFDTTPFAPGQYVLCDTPLVVSGRRVLAPAEATPGMTAAERRGRKLLLAKALDWRPHLERYEVTGREARNFWGPPIPPPPPRRLAVGAPPKPDSEPTWVEASGFIRPAGAGQPGAADARAGGGGR
jgi:hypothetical protein